ncbi:hypothetical protein ACFZDJ_50780 [Streptomyces sp. NPDC007896]
MTTRFGPRVIGSDARIQAVAFWEVASYLLNTRCSSSSASNCSLRSGH